MPEWLLGTIVVVWTVCLGGSVLCDLRALWRIHRALRGVALDIRGLAVDIMLANGFRVSVYAGLFALLLYAMLAG